MNQRSNKHESEEIKAGGNFDATDSRARTSVGFPKIESDKKMGNVEFDNFLLKLEGQNWNLIKLETNLVV